MDRRITAILVADMVGYSRLVEADEEGTLSRQRALRAELIDPALAARNGRIVKTTGDGLLAEFASVVDAVTCAMEVQRTIARCEDTEPEESRIRYRIGINLGDVVHENGDIHGDGVNVAARLEQMADPGGICISGAAHDQLQSAVVAGYEDLGEVRVKNIARPIRAYRVLLDPDRAGETIAARRRRPGVWTVAAAMVVLALVTGALWWSGRPDVTAADRSRYAFDLPDRPSIAVLAFDNLSADPSYDYVGDGLAENIIATLSGFPKLFVIARNSSLHYKGTDTPVHTVAEELGVRYVLSGAVQGAGDAIRVTAQLTDALSGRQLWARTYDRQMSMETLFAIQDDITRDIAVSLDTVLVAGDDAPNLFTDAGDLQTYILTRQTIAEFQKFTPEGNQRTAELSRQALERNPNSVIALVHLGYARLYEIPMGQSRDPAASMAAAWENANRALAIDPDDPAALGLVTWLYLAIPDHAKALQTADRMLEIRPGGGITASLAGWAYSASGYPERGAELLRFGMRTEPYFPDWVPNSLAVSLMMLGRYDEAKTLLVVQMERARGAPREWAEYELAAIAAWQGDTRAARNFIQQSIKRTGATRSIDQVRRWNRQLKDQVYLARYLEALRVAGVPEHATATSGN